jgi:hypothetical protein
MSQPNKEGSSPRAKAKSGCGRTILKGLLIAVVLAAAAGGAYYLRMEYLRSVAREETIRKDLEQPQKLALEAVQDHDEVKTALGEPVEAQGNLRREGTGELDRSNAVFSFGVGGPKAKAEVNATAKHEDGNWRVLDIKVKMTDGKTIAVPPPSKEAAQELEFKL